MKKTFYSPYALSKWIEVNIKDPLRQEQLMMEGIRWKRIHNNYTINI